MNHLAAIAAAALFAAIWQGALLAAAVAGILRLMPPLAAATRSLIWTATFALAVALHFLPAARGTVVTAQHFQPVHVAVGWSVAVAGLWLALSLYRATQFLLSAQRLRQISRRAVPVAFSVVADLRHSERSEEPLYSAGLQPRTSNCSYTLCTSPDVDRPSVLGFLHPRILLPMGLLETLTPAELQQILLHETEHLRRSDDWTNLLQKLALVFFPLNPVLFWVERRMCLERELACDAQVLAASGNLRKSYATTLTRLAEHSILCRSLSLALGILGQRPRASELATRVHNILARPAKTLGRTQTRFATAALCAGVLALAATLAHTPSLVTFGAAPTMESASSADASVPAAQSNYRAVEVVARVPAALPHRLKRSRLRQRGASAPRVIETAYGMAPDEVGQPRLALMVAGGTQVQQLVIPAVRYVPAFAAIRTPGGWIVFQL